MGFFQKEKPSWIHFTSSYGLHTSFTWRFFDVSRMYGCKSGLTLLKIEKESCPNVVFVAYD